LAEVLLVGRGFREEQNIGATKMKIVKDALPAMSIDKAFAMSARSERRNNFSCACQCN